MGCEPAATRRAITSLLLLPDGEKFLLFNTSAKEASDVNVPTPYKSVTDLTGSFNSRYLQHDTQARAKVGQ